jgi:predicted nucleic acid-binding protein
VIVVDTSALIDAVLARPPKPGLLARLSDDGDLHAPHLIDVEILHALRRLALTGAVPETRLEDARADIDDITLTRYPLGSLADRVWDLRHHLTAYDAVFVALAEGLGVPLVTCDRRLARAGGHHAHVEVFS